MGWRLRGGGVSDHGALTGLTDDDHPYVRETHGGEEVVNTVAASGTTETLDLADGNWHDVTLTDDCTFTFAGATLDLGCSFILILRQDGTGGRSVTWPGSVSWPDDTPPTLSTSPNDVDVLSFLSRDGGTTWFGSYHGAISALDDLTDVTITATAEGDLLRFDGSAWVDVSETSVVRDAGYWSPLTNGDETTPELVFAEGDTVAVWKET